MYSSSLKISNTVYVCVLYPKTKFTRKGKKVLSTYYLKQNVDLKIKWRNISKTFINLKCYMIM